MSLSFAGGGAIELELSAYLRSYAKTIPGKEQLLLSAFAKALEIIPKQLADNAGFDTTAVLNQLRAKHHSGAADAKWFGVNMEAENGVGDNLAAFVWEPALVKINALSAAAEAAALVISVDETIKDSKAGKPEGGPGGPGGGYGRPG